MNDQTFNLVLEHPGERLDKVLADELEEISRSQLQRLIKEGRVLVGGAPAKASYRLEDREVITINVPEPTPTELVAQNIPLDIRYEDDDVLVVNKPGGMVVHPAAGHQSGTLVNAVLAYCPDLAGVGGEKRPGIVHRLDKDTSGLIIVAKNETALRHLQRQFKERRVGKRYIALVEGLFAQKRALIDAPIGRDPADRKKMAVIPPGSSARAREAQTKVTLGKLYQAHSLLTCEPITGRTHQIRVHLAFAGNPIVGDRIYGRRRSMPGLHRHFLHAAEIAFNLPSGDRPLALRAELPAELQAILDSLAKPT